MMGYKMELEKIVGSLVVLRTGIREMLLKKEELKKEDLVMILETVELALSDDIKHSLNFMKEELNKEKKERKKEKRTVPKNRLVCHGSMKGKERK